ncbi:MAG TPA: rhodanese-like domain-containing protein [Acidobacteriota bacterium]|nr:rhodanese-like domain-containing protein [Acidobacteriota bacterium]
MKEVSAEEANQIMQNDPTVIYLDVRTTQEFDQGHPLRAVNIPIMSMVPGMGMVPNAEFVSVVEANIPKDANVLVGCKSGGRSARAVEILSQLGFQNLANVRSGFVGAMDMTGRIVEPGWSLLNLPLCSSCEENSSYSKLAAKAKK